MTMRKVLGYVRVSTQEQVSGFGLDVQRSAIRTYCQANSLRLLRTASDEGISGSNGLDTRPGLAAALASIEKHEAAGIVVYRLDRLARDLMLQETIIEKVHQAKGKVFSVTEADIDSEEPTRVMVRQILGAVAQYERAVIKARVMGGKAAKARRGGYTGGRPPFGWRAERKSLVPNEAEQKVIKYARQLWDEGMSTRQIAVRLEEAGYRPKVGERWSSIQVGRVLKDRSAPKPGDK